LIDYHLDTRNYPILIHCNKGKHRIGCLAACIRKMENWSLSATLDEYRRFSGTSGTKIRMDDQEVSLNGERGIQRSDD
jgi:tyrosine-protein phosphatase SIW14